MKARKISFIYFFLFLCPVNMFCAKRALLIGIDNYINDGKYGKRLNLIGCANDALDLRQTLIEDFHFRSDEIRILLNQRATKRAILEGLRWLVRETRSHDWVFFSFSGHGGQKADDDGDEADEKDEFICPTDTDSLLGLNYLTDDEIKPFIEQLKDRRGLFIFDSCHSGTIKRGLPPEETNWLAPDDFPRLIPPGSYLKESSTTRGPVYYTESAVRAAPGVDFSSGAGEIVIFSAGASNQIAIVINRESGHPNGAMTYAILSGLKGGADANRDGKITYLELLNFSKTFMRRLKYAQVPQVDATPGTINLPVFFLTPQTELLSLSNSLSSFQVTLRLVGRYSNRIRIKDKVEFEVQSQRPGHLFLFAIATDGEVTCLFPNSLQRDNFIRPRQGVIIPPRDGDFDIEASEPPGKMKILAILTTRPVNLDSFCGAHIDEVVRRLGDSELRMLVRSVSDIPSRLSSTEWTASILEVDVVR